MQAQAIQADVTGCTLGGDGQAVQHSRDVFQILLADRRERDPARRPDEQLPSDQCLQPGQLMTDG